MNYYIFMESYFVLIHPKQKLKYGNIIKYKNIYS